MLEHITKSEIESGKLPLMELLENSFYYPCSEFDGGVVKHNSREIQSFIYCDYAISEEDLISHLTEFFGYRVLGHRSVSKEELIPSGWKMQIPPDVNIEEYYRYQNSFKPPFAHWIVYERLENFDDSHGSKRFSLLYIGGEGVATYQALYWSNKKTAKALGIIQPGTGFGLNWTDFRKEDGALGWVVLKNSYGTPEIIFYGGMGNGEYALNWTNYQYAGEILPYYRNSGRVTIWEKKK